MAGVGQPFSSTLLFVWIGVGLFWVFLACALRGWGRALDEENKFLRTFIEQALKVQENDRAQFNAFLGHLECALKPGEIIDRQTIVQIKREKLTDPTVLTQLDTEATALREAFYFLYPHAEVEPLRTSTAQLFNELLEINRGQWDLEDQVRAATTPEAQFQAAYQARQSNTARVGLKNKINQLFQVIPEHKHYQG